MSGVGVEVFMPGRRAANANGKREADPGCSFPVPGCSACLMSGALLIREEPQHLELCKRQLARPFVDRLSPALSSGALLRPLKEWRWEAGWIPRPSCSAWPGRRQRATRQQAADSAVAAGDGRRGVGGGQGGDNGGAVQPPGRGRLRVLPRLQAAAAADAGALEPYMCRRWLGVCCILWANPRVAPTCPGVAPCAYNRCFQPMNST